jgi:Ca2+-binding RTX toxin-like protein
MAIEFSATTDLPLGSESNLLLARDLNGDGNLDLVSKFFGTPVAVFWGTGGGQFTAAQKYVVEQVEPNLSYQSYQKFLNSLPPGVTLSTAAPPPTINSSISIWEIVTGDVDRDGKLDLITIGSTAPQASLVGDFDGDGKLDVISEESANQRGRRIISVLKGTGSGFSTAINSRVSTLLSPQIGGLAVADFNGDGNLDVAAIPQGNIEGDGLPAASKQQVSFLLGDGTGNFGSEKSISLGIQVTDVVAADFNGDGLADLAVKGISNGYASETKISILLSDGTGGFNAPNVIPIRGGASLFAADFNSDGKIDLGTSNGYLAGENNGQFRGFQPFQLSGDDVVTGDFNGDGKLDVAGASSNGYGAGAIKILLGDGTGNYTFPAATAINFLGAIASGDFDRDGKPDVAVFNTASKSISVLLNRTTSTDALVISNGIIDASLVSGNLILDLKKGTLTVGGISKPLQGSYQIVRGTKQSDRIIGGKAPLRIDGFAGNDVITGGSSNDFLTGGFGNDTLTGGEGKNVFAFIYSGARAFSGAYQGSQLTPFNRAMGIDKITDFKSGKDTINLYRDTFTAFTGRRIRFKSVETKKAAQKSNALITYIPKTGSLFYNQNGAKAGFGSGRQFADLTNGLELQAKDFQLF